MVTSNVYLQIATRLDSEMALDMRAYTRVVLTSASTAQLIRYIHPAVYSLHNMPPDVRVPKRTFILKLTCIAI